MRGIFYLSVLIFCVQFLNAQPAFRKWNDPKDNTNQTLHTYQAEDMFPNTLISEDFGPRQLGNNAYQWHGGIDYNSQSGDNDFGDLLLAVEGGKISEHSHMMDKVKSIIIEADGSNGHHMRYVHVFTGGDLKGHLINKPNGMEVGGCLLKFMDGNKNRETWAIIVRDSGNYSAYGPEPPMPPGTVTFEDENGIERTIQVASHVEAGEGFAPLGDSENYPAHLHLEILTQTNDNGSVIQAGNDEFVKDPLQLYPHDVPSYHVGFFQEDDMTPGVDIDYPGTKEATVQVQVKMKGQDNNVPVNRYDVIMNIDNVEIKLKNATQEYALIQGPHFESLFSHGARIDQDRTRMALDLNNTIVGSWSSTHMQPFAYAGITAPNGHSPRDDYYFADFVTRMHTSDVMDDGKTEIADLPQHARYPDGKYQIMAKATDVLSNDHASAPVDFILDNFMPFVEKVAVEINNQLFYEQEFTLHDSNTEFVGNGYISQGDKIENGGYASPQQDEIKVYIKTSEPMESLKLLIPKISDDTLAYPQVDNSKTEFTFLISPKDYNHELSMTCYKMEIFGKDTHGNSLLDLGNYRESGIINIKVPTRKGSSGTTSEMWNRYYSDHVGSETLHSFCVSECVRGLISNSQALLIDSECPIEYTYSITKDSGGGDGSITVNVANSTYEDVVFYDDMGNVISNPNWLSNSIYGLEGGREYCFEIKKECCKVSKCVFVELCPGKKLKVEPNAYICPDSIQLRVSFANSSEIINPDKYSISWIYGSTSLTETYSFGDFYMVTVTDPSGCTYWSWGNAPSDVKVDGSTKPLRCDKGGSITLDITGEYDGLRWEDNGSSSITRENLWDGTYCVKVFGKCPHEKCFEIIDERQSEQKELKIIVDKVTPPFCITRNKIECDGGINISISGSEDYSISWTGSGGFSSTQEDLSDLCPGNYEIIVTTEKGCSKRKIIEVCCCEFEADEPLEHPALCDEDGQVIIPYLKFDYCFPKTPSSEDGMISITNLESGVPYEITWSGPNGFFSDKKNISRLQTGEYCVTVSSGGCDLATKEDCVELQACSTVDFSFNPSIKNDCTIPEGSGTYGAGNIILSPSGGRGSYKYQWSNGGTSQSISNLYPGEYCVTVTDKVKCQFTDCFRVGISEAMREHCYIYCQGKIVEDRGPVVAETNNENCAFVDYYCSGDNYYLGTAEVGYNISINSA